MIIIIFLIAIVITGVVLAKRLDEETPGVICTVFGSLLLLIAIVTLLVIPFQYKSNMKKLEAFTETIKSSRLDKMSEYERAAITSQVAKWNEWIAESKYFNNSTFGLWVPNAVEKLEYIK